MVKLLCLSIYNENISFKPAPRIVLSEPELMLEAGQLLVNTSWDGQKNTPLPLSIQDFDQAKLEAYIADERASCLYGLS